MEDRQPEESGPIEERRRTSLRSEISSLLNTPVPLEEFNRRIVGTCLTNVQAEQGYISLVQIQEKTELTSTFVRVNDRRAASVPLRLGIALTGWMVKHRSPLLVNDASADERFQNTEFNAMPIRSVLAVPLEVENHLIGFIALFNKREGNFTLEDQGLLKIVAQISAESIEAVRQKEEAKKGHNLAPMVFLPKEQVKIPGFEIDAVNVSAKEVGGDFFDYLSVANGRWWFAVGDVEGKGPSAARLMTLVQATLRAQMKVTDSCTRCLCTANNLLKLSIAPGRFATVFLSILDPVRKIFSYSAGGHNPAFLFSPDGRYRLLGVGGPILGVFDSVPFEEETLPLEPGQVLIIYSDGIPEAFNKDELQFGQERFLETARKALARPASEILSRVTEAVFEFCGKPPATDDVTLLVIKAL